MSRPSPDRRETSIGPERAAASLVLLRHGQSTANAAGLFTGWWDVDLTGVGRDEARHAARLLVARQWAPDAIFLSPLRRARQTVEIVLEEIGCPDSTTVVCPQLTGRAYGALTGRSKTEICRIFGAERSQRWRRSLTGRPPRLSDVDPARWAGTGIEATDADVAPAARAVADHCESLADVITRVRAWEQERLLPCLDARRRVLVVAHGNSLRALITLLDDLDPAQTEALNIPTGQPLRYAVDDDGRPHPRSSRYLDAPAARAAARKVAGEGGT